MLLNMHPIDCSINRLYLQGSGTKVDFTIQSPGYPEYYTGKSCVCTLTTSKDQDRVSFHYRFNSWRPTDKVGISFVCLFVFAKTKSWISSISVPLFMSCTISFAIMSLWYMNIEIWIITMQFIAKTVLQKIVCLKSIKYGFSKRIYLKFNFSSNQTLPLQENGSSYKFSYHQYFLTPYKNPSYRFLCTGLPLDAVYQIQWPGLLVLHGRTATRWLYDTRAFAFRGHGQVLSR